ncbi:MAG: beta-propeller fold lactonase family protein [Verrucomicrobia bacterium]|nr:beta-propeller fold lactonase family protein [Verrucomicrobiota bacterium]
MKSAQRFAGCAGLLSGLFLCVSLVLAGAVGVPEVDVSGWDAGVFPFITPFDWGAFGAAVAGTSETGAYTGAELFAGPRKFTADGDNDYYHGVLPNGKIVKPAGVSSQVGMNPLGIALTPDGKFAIVSCDDERKGSLTSLQGSTVAGRPLKGGYSLTVLDTSKSPMPVLSQVATQGKLFVGLQVVKSGSGYTLYASGGGDDSIKLFQLDAAGSLTARIAPAQIVIAPTLPADQGYVSHEVVSADYNLRSCPSPASDPSPNAFGAGAQTTFPAGIHLSPDGRYLYVACDGDNSLAVIDTAVDAVVAQCPAGYFPYDVAVSADGTRVAVSNWGLTEYKFAHPSFNGIGQLTALGTTGPNLPAGFFLPVTDTAGANPRTSSVSLFRIGPGEPLHAQLLPSVYEGKSLDKYRQVGGTHPSAIAVIKANDREILYVARSNDDSLGLIDFATGLPLKEVRLPFVCFPCLDFFPFLGFWPYVSFNRLKGAYPDALVASHDGRRLYVAEAGINSVAVLDTRRPDQPKLIGRIPAGWYPAALALSPDDKVLYVVNAKGVGEDVNPRSGAGQVSSPSTGVESFADSNYIFGSVQKVVLSDFDPPNRDVYTNNVKPVDRANHHVVPLGGRPSAKIKTVIFIETENKSFDSKFGAIAQFGPYASTTFYNADRSTIPSPANQQYIPVTQNLQLLARTFAVGANYYSDSEESDAGHQFCAAGTATDYTEKTLLVKTGRGLLVNKNFEPEDYPASGYLFNNAARHGVSFKDYGELIRIDGTDTGTSYVSDAAGIRLATPDDPASGKMGCPTLPESNPVIEHPESDVDSPTQGLGQSYFLDLPILAVLGEPNPNGEPHLDRNYPGYNFNISDQRRAKEFIKDFDRMLKSGSLPQFLYLYLPNEHTGATNASNFGFDAAGEPIQPTALEQVEDTDVAIGMVIAHLMQSRVYYDLQTGTGAAIFIVPDDAQASLDHIHPHRSPLVMVSPFAKPHHVGTKHYSTASIVKTEELLLGLPPNNLGDLLASDLSDLFQDHYNGINLSPAEFNRTVQYQATPAGRRIWTLASRLNLARPDQDSRRLGALGRLSQEADFLYKAARKHGALHSRTYQKKQRGLIAAACRIVNAPARDGDSDD